MFSFPGATLCVKCPQNTVTALAYPGHGTVMPGLHHALVQSFILDTMTPAIIAADYPALKNYYDTLSGLAKLGKKREQARILKSDLSC